MVGRGIGFQVDEMVFTKAYGGKSQCHPEITFRSCSKVQSPD